MVKKMFATLGLGTVILLGAAQLAQKVEAAPPPTSCAAVLCIPCPEGYVLSPTPGRCCRCVKQK